MPQPLSEEKRQQWKEIILKQRGSGLSAARWCRQNNIVTHAFFYWQDKLFPKAALDRSAFTEIPDKKKVKASGVDRGGITVEYHGVRILLDGQFEPATLKQCLEVLKEVVC
jgi:hypothetical protein